MSTRVTIVLWDPKGRTEETWDRVAKTIERARDVAIIDVTVEEVEED